jgi:hypothetical protein
MVTDPLAPTKRRQKIPVTTPMKNTNPDLCGVILCDVLTLEHEAVHQVKCEAILLLDYVSMPDDMTRIAKVKGDALLYHDMAFINNHLKCVDLASRSCSKHGLICQ